MLSETSYDTILFSIFELGVMVLNFIIVFLLSFFLISGCTSTSVTSSEANKQSFAHLHQIPSPVSSTIPKPLQFRPILSKPSTLSSTKKLFSISASNIPVDKLLFKLAVNANRQLDLSSLVHGKVTVFVKNRPLDVIVRQVAEQVGARYQITPQTIKVYPDTPYWQTYKIDYVNLEKTTKSDILLNMSVGGSGGASSSSSTSGSSGSQSTVTVTTHHDFWRSLLGNLKILLGQNSHTSSQSGEQTKTSSTGSTASNGSTQAASKVLINRESGVVSVYANQKQQSMVKRFLDEVSNRVNKQVLIEATVVEVELSDRYQAGIDWSALGSSGSNTYGVAQNLVGGNLSSNSAFSINLANVASNFTFNLGLKMLQKFGNTKVLSSPKIMAINNQMALLKVVDNQVYFTLDAETTTAGQTGSSTTTFTSTVHTVPVGFMMSVTPFVADDNSISLDVRPTLSRIIRYVKDPNPSLAQNNIESLIPVIQEREMSSVLRLQDRQTAIIGGLIQNLKNKDDTQVPLLGSIPWVGELFKSRDDSKTKSELVIFIRPVIIKNPDVNLGDLKSLRQFLPKPTPEGLVVR